MRTKLRTGLTLIAACLGCLPGARAQPAAGAGAGRSDNVAEDIGPDHRVRPGRIAGRSVVEIGTGMNHWDGKQWVPSDAAFDLTKDAFVADRLNFQVRLEGNLNTVGAVMVVTPDGTKLKSSPIGFGLHDPVTGASLVIASVADCVGVQTAANTVVYENAFAGVCANVVYHIAPASFEQDVVLTGKLDPAAYGFDPRTVQLQIFTEFYGAPQPETVKRPLRVEKDPAVRQRMVQPDLVDEILGFGEFVLGTGRAFTARSSGESGVAVAKTLAQVEGRTILIETLDYALLQKEFAALPDCLLAPGGAALGAKRASGYAGLPKAGANKQANTAPATTTPRQDFALAGQTAGIVVDYQATLGGTLSSATIFRGDTTYFISGPVVCNGAATIEGGAVFKYPTNATAYLKLTSTVTCRTSPYRPAVFTAADDDTVGDPITTGIWSGYTGTINPGGYGNPALWLYYTSQTLSNLRFRYCQEAVRFEGSANVWTLSHSQLANCIRGVVINGCVGCGSSGATLTVNNSLLAGVLYPVNPNHDSVSDTWTHCTVDGATRLVTATAATTFTAKNSVFAHIGLLTSGSVTLAGNNDGFYASGTFGSAATTSGGNPFQTVGAGRYYLASGSSFLNLGTTSGIATALLADLKLRTTYPPRILTGGITADTTLGPQAQRDTDLPDLGYHYDPLDYAVNTLDVTNAVLTLANGVALATYGDYGLVLRDYAQLRSAGTPQAHNHLVRYYGVQEQPINWGGGTVSTASSIVPVSTGASPPSAQLGFTDFDGVAGGGYHLQAVNSSGWKFTSLQLKDCTLNSGLFCLDGPSASTLSLSNNLFEWINLSCVGSPTLAADNNLFRYGTNTLVNAGGTWTFQDNAYDLSVITASGSAITASYNAYITTNLAVTGRFTPTNAADVVLPSFTYATGPLGNYYHASTTLDDKGSRAADLAGLYHYTAKTSNVKEGNTPVDIGFHYVSVGRDETVWVEDQVPAGAAQVPEPGQGSWIWGASPTPFSGALQHASILAAGGHQHYFYNATDTLAVASGDTLFAYVYLDPANPPAAVMLQWNTGGSWEHRAYWGANLLAPGLSGAANAYMGPLPATGKWIRLEVPASVVALEGTTLNGMAYTLYDGRAWWDRGGKTHLTTGSTIPADADGDGIPDYLEDANGNGTVDPGETSWTSYNSANGLGAGNAFQVFTPLK